MKLMLCITAHSLRKLLNESQQAVTESATFARPGLRLLIDEGAINQQSTSDIRAKHLRSLTRTSIWLPAPAKYFTWRESFKRRDARGGKRFFIVSYFRLVEEMKIYKGAAVDGDDETETKESRCAVDVKYSSKEHMFTRHMLFLLKKVEIRDRL